MSTLQPCCFLALFFGNRFEHMVSQEADDPLIAFSAPKLLLGLEEGICGEFLAVIPFLRGVFGEGARDGVGQGWYGERD